MRLTLFFLFLFSTLSGYHASAAQATLGSHVFHHSGKQYTSSISTDQERPLFLSIDAGSSSAYFTAADVEDEEDSDNLSLRKTKAVVTSDYIIILSRLHSYRALPLTLCGISSCKYITQRNLRI